MYDEDTTFPLWPSGQDILYRFWRLDGSLSAVHPARVVESDADSLLCWVLPDTPIRITTAPDGRKPREIPLAERFSGPRVPGWSTWQVYPTLRLVFADRLSSVWWFFEPDGTFRNWYVNLELPLGADADGIDRVDGVLDVAVSPDCRWEWKDEDELSFAVAAGRFGQEQVESLRSEGKRLITLADAGEFPFDGTYCDLRPNPNETPPRLPAWLRAES